MYKKLSFVLIIATACTNKIITPPVIKGEVAIDEYHGIKVEDSYKNLENLKDSLVTNWLQDQGEIAFETLKKIPRRNHLIHKQHEFDKEKSYSVGSIKSTLDGKYFYIKTIAGENLGKLYYRSNLKEDESLLFDSSVYKNDANETYVINFIEPNESGDKIAVSISKQGEELSEILVIDVDSGIISPNVINNCKPNIGGIRWLKNISGFVVLHFPKVDTKNVNYGLNTASVLYKLEDDSDDLIEVFSRTNNPELKLKPEDYPVVYIDNDISFGEVRSVSPFKDMYYKSVANLLNKTEPWKLLYDQSDMVKKVRVFNGNFIFLSAKSASNYQIAKTSITNPDFKNSEVLVAENKNEVIRDFEVTKDGIFYVRVKNGVEAKLYHYRDGKEQEIELPTPSGRVEIKSDGDKYSRLQVALSGWTKGNTSYIYDTEGKSFTSLNLNPVSHYKDFENLVVEEVEVPSHDGIKFPGICNL